MAKSHYKIKPKTLLLAAVLLQQAIKFTTLRNPYDLLAKDKNGKNSVKFGIYGIPESILINKELMIIQKFVGPLSVDDYNNIIKIIE